MSLLLQEWAWIAAWCLGLRLDLHLRLRLHHLGGWRSVDGVAVRRTVFPSYRNFIHLVQAVWNRDWNLRLSLLHRLIESTHWESFWL